MAVTPERLLEAATSIAKGDQEVDWRNATSRAYYAAYHRCRLVAQEARFSLTEAGSVHAALVETLTTPLSSAPLKSMGYLLEQCRRRRVRADYRIDENFSRDIANAVLADSKRILEKAGTL
ncbi:MAG: hypothetical protein F4X81_10595 [Gammaproteobacteria bacterium]|nr:hypothetical protein [Gammaproteobacteria bacterium]MYE51900.1 hypothetical protein [Gammaproteobacteria bacterium]MYF51186.1 hypothetical protein [Gammaproteobacteria bacterium]MYH16275.1 hypothetical protein [Gammaproteobacteria bacterium]MYK83821.1 hypothetical protein [Gammaproteobacteria bacterium]